jgi:hypothetical protein
LAAGKQREATPYEERKGRKEYNHLKYKLDPSIAERNGAVGQIVAREPESQHDGFILGVMVTKIISCRKGAVEAREVTHALHKATNHWADG